MARNSLAFSALALVIAACSAGNEGATQTRTTGTAEPAASVQVSEAASPQVAAPAAAALAPWMTHELTDVRSTKTFAIADFAGKVVVVEPMAIWCSNCLQQQKAAAKALASLDRDDVVYISLDVDPSERAADLAAYADERGFDWRFVVSDRSMSRALAQAFGDQVLSPPSTPKIIVARDGHVSGPNFGIQDASTLEAELRDLTS